MNKQYSITFSAYSDMRICISAPNDDLLFIIGS